MIHVFYFQNKKLFAWIFIITESIASISFSTIFKNFFFLISGILIVSSQVLSQPQPPLLNCSVSAPDSLHFDKVNYNRYISGTFPIQIMVTNSGSAKADSVVVFVRSNQRFNIVPPASKLVADSLGINDTVKTDFLLSINPKSISGYDTITVAVSGKSGARTECQWLIWVEKEYKPGNEIICPPDSSIQVAFADTVNDYFPNPIVVPITVINHGDAPSKETKIIYVATPGVTPAVGQIPIYEVGTIAPNEIVSETFRLKIVRRTSDTTVDLHFRVQGKGGLGDRIIDTLCTYRLFIPAARDVEFQLACKNSLQIKFENGVYTPNPFLWKATVKNAGNAIAKNVQATIALPPSVQLDSASSSKINLGNMVVGEEKTIEWKLKAKIVLVPDTSEICVYVFDEFNRNARCCDTLILPAMKQGELRANCITLPDSIFVDPESGEYIPKEFLAQVQISNSGNEAIDSVWVEITINDPDIILVSPPQVTQFVTTRLGSLQSTNISWRLGCRSSTTARIVSIQFRVHGLKIDQVSTLCSIYVAAALQPALTCSTWSVPNDTVHILLPALTHEPLTIRARCKNVGSLFASNVTATILLPPYLTLASNDSASKKYPKGILAKDSLWYVEWSLLPIKQREGKLDSIRVEFRSGNVQTNCEDWIFVVGIPPLTVLSIPRNLVERYGNTIKVPIKIDDTQNKDVKRIELQIDYDNNKVDYLNYDLTGSLIEKDWIATPTLQSGKISLILTSSKSLETAGDLIYLLFQVVFGDGDEQLKTSGTELHFDSLACSINRGGVIARYYDGFMIVSGKCVYPMNATEKYIVLQNRPNPFSESTEIEFVVSERGHVTLAIYDVLGKKIKMLVNDERDAGRYSVRWDASMMNTGIYFCILDQDRRISVMKLIVTNFRRF